MCYIISVSKTTINKGEKMVASKSIQTLIRENKNGRFIYRGMLTESSPIGYPSDTKFEIWDDTRDQKTWHVPVYSVDNSTERV